MGEKGVRERPPQPGVTYRAYADPSGGRADNFAVAIAHRVGDVAVLDAVRAWRLPFDPAHVVGEVAALLRRYAWAARR